MTTRVDKLNLENNKHKTLNYVFTILKSFFFVVVASALFFGIFRSIKAGSLLGFVDGMLFGLLLAIVLVPIIVSLDIFQRFKNYRKYQRVDFNVNQVRRLLIKDEYNLIFNKLCDFLKDRKEFTIYNKDLGKGIIEADVKKSWKSFGEKLQIRLWKGSDGKVYAEITSKPKIVLTMIDYAKNFENIESIMTQLERSFDISF
jgi:hypothetical protein